MNLERMRHRLPWMSTPRVACCLVALSMALCGCLLPAARAFAAEACATDFHGACAQAASDRQTWLQVFSIVARQADAGSVAASATAMEMHRHGLRVYGMRFDATEGQVRRWQRQLRCTPDSCTADG
jgi:hypothetical protein